MALTPLATLTTRLGLMEPRPLNATEQTRALQRVQKLGMDIIRPLASFANNAAEDRSLDITYYKNQGLKIVLTVFPNPQPSTYPTDTAAYTTGLASLLDQYTPIVVCIANEQNNSTTYWNDTVQKYLDLLTLSKPVCAARNIPMADGGLAMGLLVTMAADWILQGAFAVGSMKSAYLTRAYSTLSSTARNNLAANIARPYAEALGRSLPSVNYLYNLVESGRAQIDRGLQFIHGYHAATLGADLINFHMYVSDPTTIQYVVEMLAAEESRLPIMCNECGLWNENPDEWSSTLTNIHTRTSANAPVIVYDLRKAYDRAQSIYYDNTAALKPSGMAVRGGSCRLLGAGECRAV